MRKTRWQAAAASAALLAAGGVVPVITAAPAHAATCSVSGDTSHSPDSCGPYSDPNILHNANYPDGANVLNDVWSPPPGYTNADCAPGSAAPCQTTSATDAEHWTVTANLPDRGGAVQSYPDTQQVFTLPSVAGHPNGYPDALSNYPQLTSSWTQAVPPAADSWDAGYDIWGGSVSASDGNWADEIMIWTGQANRAGCGGAAPVLTGIQFGGANGVPVQSWNLYLYGSERIWCNPSLQEPAGSADVYGMLHYLMAPGYTGAGALPGDFGLNAVEYGIEWCWTPGTFDSFTLSQFSLAEGAGGGGTQQAPAVTDSAATGVTASGAVLNGTVNPEGAATTYQFDYGLTAGYGSSTAAGSAGSGTAAVSESAGVSGLSPATTYHYRIEAANSAGTAFGTDQQFTTAAAGGGTAVAPDTAAGARTANAATLSWTQPVGSGSNRALLAEEAIGVTNDAGCSPSATYDGIPMTEITAVHSDNQHAGVLVVWGLAAPPAGTFTIHVAVKNCTGGTPSELTGGSESFTGASQASPWGAHAVSYGNSAQSSVSVASAGTGNLVGEFAANGSAVTAAVSPVVPEFTENQDNSTGAGNSAGGYAPGASGTVTGKWALSTDWWGAAAVDIAHA